MLTLREYDQLTSAIKAMATVNLVGVCPTGLYVSQHNVLALIERFSETPELPEPPSDNSSGGTVVEEGK